MLRHSAATLSLPAGRFDYSGSLTLVADLEHEGGHQAQSPALHVFFHPTQTGWLVYDAAGRASRHDDGALTETALAQRTAIEAEGGASVAFAGRSPVRKISESASFVPDNDVPVDSDGAM